MADEPPERVMPGGVRALHLRDDAADAPGMRPRRRAAPPAPAVERRLSVSPDDVVRQNERTRSGLVEEESAVQVGQVDLEQTLVPQIRALLGRGG